MENTKIQKVMIVLCLIFVPSCSYTVANNNLGIKKSIPYAEIELQAGDLGGVFVDAGKEAPIIIIVPGSGPINRNGNSPHGITANTYRLLSEQLAERGISTLRVDKFGMYSSSAAGDPNSVTVSSYAEDYRSWVDKIRTKTNARCVYLLGHSEGGTMVSAAAIKRADVCGLILVSAPGRMYGDVLRDQLQENPANKPILDEAFVAIEALERKEKVDVTNMHPGLIPLFKPSTQGYLVSLMAIDPAKLLKKANKETQIIQGSTDLQTTIADAYLLANAIGGEPVIINGVNHILKYAPEQRSENLMTYLNSELPIAMEVIETIEEFVTNRRR